MCTHTQQINLYLLSRITVGLTKVAAIYHPQDSISSPGLQQWCGEWSSASLSTRRTHFNPHCKTPWPTSTMTVMYGIVSGTWLCTTAMCYGRWLEEYCIALHKICFLFITTQVRLIFLPSSGCEMFKDFHSYKEDTEFIYQDSTKPVVCSINNVLVITC